MMGVARLGANRTAELPAVAVPYPLPELRVVNESGAPWVRRNASQIWIFVDSRCGHCHNELAKWGSFLQQHGDSSGLEVIVVTRAKDRRALPLAPTGMTRVFDQHGDVARALAVSAVPTLVRVDAGGVVQERFMGVTSPETKAGLRARALVSQSSAVEVNP